MAPKRSIVRVPAQPPAKKAKVIIPTVMDPISKKIALVSDALADESIEVPCREMLKIAAPMVLQLAHNTRHAYETKVASMIEEVFTAQVTNCACRLEHTTKAVEEAQTARDTINSDLADIQRQLETKAADVSSCRDEWKADSDAREQAEQALKAAERVVEDFEQETRIKAQDLEDCGSAIETLKVGLAALPPGDRDARLLNVSQQLKSASADMSLQSATPLALQKMPEERGTFDVMAIEQVESLLQKHRVVLEERLEGRDDLKGEKVAAVKSAQNMVQSAVEKCKESSEKLKTAERAEKERQTEQKAKEKLLSTQVKEVNKLLKQQALDKKELDRVNEIFDAFTFLAARDSSTPVEEADAPACMENPLATLHYVSVGGH